MIATTVSAVNIDIETERLSGASISTSSFPSSPKPTRKRQKSKEEELWKRNVNKKMRQSGQSYINTNNVQVSPRKILPTCLAKCPFKCTSNFSDVDRTKIFDDFWKLNDNEKLGFYFKFVKRISVKRRRAPESTKKKLSFQYYFQVDDRINRVCRMFFLNTVNISKKKNLLRI